MRRSIARYVESARAHVGRSDVSAWRSRFRAAAMSEAGFPISHPYELGRLPQAGDEVVIAPSADDLARIAHWAGVDARGRAEGEDRAAGSYRRRDYASTPSLEADIVQSCVVTLDPVRIAHRAQLSPATSCRPPRGMRRRTSMIDVAPLDEDGREEIPSLRYDLAVARAGGTGAGHRSLSSCARGGVRTAAGPGRFAASILRRAKA